MAGKCISGNVKKYLFAGHKGKDALGDKLTLYKFLLGTRLMMNGLKRIDANEFKS